MGDNECGFIWKGSAAELSIEAESTAIELKAILRSSILLPIATMTCDFAYEHYADDVLGASEQVSGCIVSKDEIAIFDTSGYYIGA